MSTVAKLMSAPATVVASEMPFDELVSVMSGPHVHRVVVEQGGTVVGVVSDRELSRALPSPFRSAAVRGSPGARAQGTAGAVMATAAEVIAPTAPVADAARLMLRTNVSCLPVVQNGRVLGVITVADCLRFLLTRRHPTLRVAAR